MAKRTFLSRNIKGRKKKKEKVLAFTKPGVKEFVEVDVPTFTDKGPDIPASLERRQRGFELIQEAETRGTRKKKKGILTKIAEVGLTPAAASAKFLGTIFGIEGAKLSIGEIAEKAGETPTGKVLGLGTVAAGLLLGGVAATKLTAVSKIAQIGKISTRTGISREIISKFATNTKSLNLTFSLLRRVVTNPAFIIGAIGSYPFSHFIKEEALQTLNIVIFKAVNAGDLEGATELTNTVNEMLDEQKTIIDWIPFANIVKKFIGKNGFFAAAEKANREWERIIEIMRTQQ